MEIIELDTTRWTNVADLYAELLPALGAPAGHGTSVNALIDSIIWGGINQVSPPLLIRFLHTSQLPESVMKELRTAKVGLCEASKDFYKADGQEIDVTIELIA